MLNIGEEIVGRIVPGKLECSVNGHKDMFVEKSLRVIRLEAELEEAKREQRDRRVAHILVAFRKVFKEFFETYGTRPTKIYMNWRDVGHLQEAYNAERITLLDPQTGEYPRERVSECSDEAVIDGILVKKGCDREPAMLNIHSFE